MTLDILYADGPGRTVECFGVAREALAEALELALASGILSAETEADEYVATVPYLRTETVR